MKKSILGLVFFAGSLFSAASVNAQDLYFFVKNETGFDLNNVYIKPVESGTWSKDLLPTTLLKEGTEIKITIPASYGESCNFDLQITDLEGTAVNFKNFDACKLYRMYIYDDATYKLENE